MILLLDNTNDNSLAARAFVAQAAGLGHAAVDAYAEHAHQINAWGIGRLPCLAAIHDGAAVYQASDAARLPTFEADAQAAVDAYEAAKGQG